MDSRHDHQTEDDADGPPMSTKDELRAIMDRSDADVAAGRTTPLPDVLAELRGTAAGIRAKRARDKAAARVK